MNFNWMKKQPPVEGNTPISKTEKKLHILMAKVSEILADAIRNNPQESRIPVQLQYPDSEYKGILEFRRGDAEKCGINTYLFPEGSDRAVMHYLFSGTGEACLEWLKNPETVETLCQDFAQLKAAQDRRDD